jgi:hypothetical protein
MCSSFQESDLYFAAKGMAVVNVPQGKYALAWVGTESLVLDQGAHVLAVPTLLPVTAQSLVDQTSLYIRHGNLHILRVPPGELPNFFFIGWLIFLVFFSQASWRA